MQTKGIDNKDNSLDVLHMETLISALNNIKNKVNQGIKEEKYTYSKNKLINVISGTIFLSSNLLVGLFLPELIGLSLISSGVLFGSLCINSIIESYLARKNIKSLNNKLLFFNAEIENNYEKLIELKLRTKKEEKTNNRDYKHTIVDVYKKDLLFDICDINKKKLFALNNDNKLCEYLERQNYSQKEIELMTEIIEKEEAICVAQANEQIAQRHYGLSRKAKNLY